MQQAAQSAQTSDGAQRQPNARRPRRRGGRRKGRRRGRRKTNPSPVTWILIAGASAAAVGGGIAWGLHRRRKKREAILPGNGNGQLPGGGGTRPGGGGGTQGARQNAPAFPYNDAEARAVEQAWATTVYSEATTGGKTSFTDTEVNRLTDLAFDEIYGTAIKVPPPSRRGSGWQPYIDSWLRIKGIISQFIEGAGGNIS